MCVFKYTKLTFIDDKWFKIETQEIMDDLDHLPLNSAKIVFQGHVWFENSL